MARYTNKIRAQQSTSNFNRNLKFESLESKDLLSISQGITATEFNEITAQFSGFDYSSIQAGKVWVVESNAISSASIREAITAAQKASGPDMIVVRTNDVSNLVTFKAASESFTIDDASSLILVAQGTQSLTINAADLARIFSISKRSSVQLGNMNLTHGKADNGGAVYCQGKLVLDQMSFLQNEATANGGALYTASILEAVNSVFSGNTSRQNGGALYLTGSYVSKDKVFQSEIVNCTVTGNTTDLNGSGKGGGIYFNGQGDNSDIFSHLTLNNSIIVNNRSASTAIDTNIYNSLWYNEIEFDGETHTFEIAIPALIDGDNNLTTFSYWVSYYDEDDPSQVGTNQLYNRANPLFVRDYDFTTDTDGDYSLVESPLSQAIDQGSTAYAIYVNGKSIGYDRKGNQRIHGTKVDIGAYEFVPPNIDLSTGNGGRLSGETVLFGSLVQVQGISITNNDNRTSQAFTVRFYASEDTTISSTDIPLGETVVYSLDGKATRILDSCPLRTTSLIMNQNWYLGWIIESDLDVENGNNTGICPTPLAFYNESTSVTGNLEKEEYIVSQGTEFYLAVANDYPSNAEYWWDIGTGYYVRGNSADWINSDLFGWAPGQYNIRLKVFNPATQSVIGTASSILTVLETTPCIEVHTTSLCEEHVLVLDLNVDSFDRTIRQWRINWGDGSPTEIYDRVSCSLSLGHYYSKTSQTKTCNIQLTIIDTNNRGTDIQYGIVSHVVPGSSVRGAVVPEAVAIPEENETVRVYANTDINTVGNERKEYLPLTTNTGDTNTGRSVATIIPSRITVKARSKEIVSLPQTEQLATAMALSDETQWHNEEIDIPFSIHPLTEKEKIRLFLWDMEFDPCI